jgi:hypothetical protein
MFSSVVAFLGLFASLDLCLGFSDAEGPALPICRWEWGEWRSEGRGRGTYLDPAGAEGVSSFVDVRSITVVRRRYASELRGLVRTINDRRDEGTHRRVVPVRSTDTDAEVEEGSRVVVTTRRHLSVVDFVRWGGFLDLGGRMVLWFLDVNRSAGILRVGG